MEKVPLLKVRNVRKHYGRFRALSDVSFDLDEGGSLVIFGGNGAGKTTLVKILTTLMRPTSGTLELGGHDLLKNANDARHLIGLISHSVFLYRDLNALQNLRYFGRLYGIGNLDGRVRELLEGFGLAPRMYDPVRTYSRGMLQRLTIARAVIHNPRFLILDEPFTGLDRNAVENLKNLLREFREEGRTLLMVTHNVERGLEIADSLAILAEGKLAWQGDGEGMTPERFREIYEEHSVEGVG